MGTLFTVILLVAGGYFLIATIIYAIFDLLWRFYNKKKSNENKKDL